MRRFHNLLTPKQSTSIILFCIISLGTLLRLSGLEHESLWNDELSSWFRSSYSTLDEVITRGVIPDVHPPGFQVLLYFVEKTTGESAFSLRLPSAIAGILTIPILFHIGKKLFCNSTALLASAMLAVSPVHIWLSQEARPYAILIFLTTATIALLLNLTSSLASKKPLSLWSTSGFLLGGILLEYSHYFGLLVYILQIAYLLYVSFKIHRQIPFVAAICIAPLLAYIPWIPIAVSQSGTATYIPPSGLSTVVALFLEYMGWSKLLLVLFAVTITSAILVYLRRTNSKQVIESSNLLIPILWLLLPLTISLSLSLLLVPVFTVRNMMIALPGVLLLFAVSIQVLFKPGWQRTSIGVALCTYMLISLLFVRKHYTEPHRNQFREAAAFVVENYNEQEQTVILASSWNIAYFNYYLQRNNGNLSVDLKLTDPEDYDQFTLLSDSIYPTEVWWLWGHLEPDSLLIDEISSHFETVEYYPLIGAGVWHLQAAIP